MSGFRFRTFSSLHKVISAITGNNLFLNEHNDWPENQNIIYIENNRRKTNMTYLDYHTAIKSIFTSQFFIRDLNNLLPDEYYVYRGLTITNINSDMLYERLTIGQIITNPTVSSSSTEFHVAYNFFNKPKKYVQTKFVFNFLSV
jgi:hypothetical protein